MPSGIYKHKLLSEETKKKMSDGRKGEKHPMFGKHHSKESKEKISKNNGRFWLGKKRPELIGKLVGNKFRLGLPSPMKGKHHSMEAKQKMRLSHLGKIPSLEQRIKQSEALKGKMPKNLHLLDNSGAKSHWWKGGITPKNELTRKGKEFKLWRELIFERDNWTCQKCLLRSNNLNPHHILNFSSNEELRFNIDNGITLCRICHYAFHSKYGFVNNTKEQIDKFLCQQ